MSDSKPVVAASVKSYPPAFRSGGPTRSMAEVANRLSSDFEFRVVTSMDDNGHDLREDGVVPIQWQPRANARVSAIPLGKRASFRVLKQLRSVDADIVYLNSLFHPVFTLAPLLARRFGLLRPALTVIAPRGELDLGALKIKSRRKRRMLRMLRLFGLTKRVVWHATSEDEASNIERVFGTRAEVVVASNLRALEVQTPTRRPRDERVHVVFMSKIDRKKNLETAVGAVAKCPNATLTVIGPIKDEQYWAEVLDRAASTGVINRFDYVGTVEPDRIINRLRAFDLFILPTHGENFGHAILEALAAGVPVLVSDKTPWSHVEAAGAGWVCDPSDVAGFADRIRSFHAMDDDQRHVMRLNAAKLAEKYVNDPAPVEAHRQLFGLPVRVS